MTSSVMGHLRIIYDEAQKVPDWYLATISSDGIDPDVRTVFYNTDEGRGRRSIGNLGNIRAMGRVCQAVQAVSELLLEGEGPLANVSLFQEAVARSRRDTLAHVKQGLLDLQAAPPSAQAECPHQNTLFDAVELINRLMETVREDAVRSPAHCAGLSVDG